MRFDCATGMFKHIYCRQTEKEQGEDIPLPQVLNNYHVRGTPYRLHL